MRISVDSYTRAGRNRQFGFSLLELSLAVIVLGTLTAVAAGLYQNNLQKTNQVHFSTITDDAEQAILGYLFAYGRLPCPASSMAGTEDCTTKVGYYPHKTLGLTHGVRNSVGLPLRYAIYSKPGVLENNIELEKAVDRFRPFMADVWTGSPPFAQLQTLNNINSLDLCQAIQSGYSVAADTNYLMTGSGTNAQPVAYLLFSAGNTNANGAGTLLDGANTPTGMTFESLNAAGTALNDDQLKAVHFSQLWEQLGCNGVLSPVGHGHPNAVSTAVIMQQALADYKVQLDIAVDIAKADVAAAAAVVAGAAAGIASAAATPPIGTAQAINTAGAMAPAVAASATAVTLAALGTASAAAAVVKAALNLDNAEELYRDVDPLITQINALAATIRTNAIAADAAGLYER